MLRAQGIVLHTGLLVALSLWLAQAAAAARLDKDACDALKAEQATLVGAGLREQMSRGPEWARANLSREKLAGIQRLIEVEEQIAFRCERPRPAVATAAAPPEGEEAAKAPKGAQAAPAAESAGEEAAVPAKKTKKSRKPKPADAAAVETQPAPVEHPEAKVQAVPAPPPAAPAKKKSAKKPADDAFVPPKPAIGAAEAGSATGNEAKNQQ